jgi:hypothetical protein
MRVALTTIAVVMVEVVAWTGVQAQESPDIEALMRKVGIYANWFVNRFSNVVSEEVYEQRFSGASRRRQLKSEFMLVGYPGSTQALMTFRDIREVDGKPVGDQNERITRLFLEPFENAIRRAQEIHRDGLRHTIENGRMMDPLTVIGYLQPAYLGNFRVSRGGLAKNLGPYVREITLTPLENRSATPRVMVSRSPFKPARAWVAEDTGAVLKTELRSGFGVRSEITTTTFAMDATLEMPVPVEMRDEYPRGRDDFIGVAKYSNFRRFTVRTDAAVDVPPAKP